MRRVRCPVCGKNVTKGIRKWRCQVRCVHAYQKALAASLDNTIRMITVGPNCRNTSEAWDGAEREGIRAAIDVSRTEINRIVYSHHSHIGFVLAERKAGHLPADLLI